MPRFELQASALRVGIGVIRIRGSVDSSNVVELTEAFGRLFHEGNFKILVDLKDTDYISSVGIGCFTSAYTTALKQGGRLVFVAASPGVREVFELVGLTQIMRFVRDETSALEQFSS